MFFKSNSVESTFLLIVIFVLNLSACSTNKGIVSIANPVEYKYPHQCRKNGQLVNHFIAAKVSLTLDDLKKLKPTLEENLGLDYDSCVFIGDIKILLISTMDHTKLF